jgi:hypothetical protein
VSVLVLDGPCCTMFWDPPPRISIPAGRYRVRHVGIYDNHYLHTWKPDDGTIAPPLIIAEGQTTRLGLGAPVTAFIEPWTGATTAVALNYRVAGAGGEIYSPGLSLTSSGQNGPTFKAFLDGKQICAGDFRYG